MLRGRVKYDLINGAYGFLEVPGGGPDHFFHIKQRRTIVADVNGVGFTDIPVEDGRLPKAGEWVIFKSEQVPGKSQPQAMPWAYAEELETPFRRVSNVFVECMRLMGITA